MLHDDVRTGDRRRAASRGARSRLPGAALAVAATAGLVLAGPTTPAAALSCAEFDFDAAGFAAGGGDPVEQEAASSPENWRRAYDGAVPGTVTDVATGPEDSRITRVEVTGAFGAPVPSRVEVRSPDAGWGDGLEPGEHYLIPYRAPGFESSVCDPVLVVPETDVPALVAASETGLWPRPADAPAHRLGVLRQDPEADPVGAPDTGLPGGWALPAGGAAAGLAVVLLVRRQVRRRAAADVTQG